MYKKHESGQAAIIIALVLVAMIAFVALAVDGGNAYAAKREAQNAADGAAMAAARQLIKECGQKDLVDNGLSLVGPNAQNILAQVNSLASANGVNVADYPVVVSYLDQDGAELAPVSPFGAVPCGCGSGFARGVQVTVSNPQKSFLAGVVGTDILSAKATARAKFGQVSTVAGSGGLRPITRIVPAPGQTFVIGQQVRIRDLNNEVNPGNFGWLSWDGSNNTSYLIPGLEPPGNSQDYRNAHDFSDRQISIGDWVEGMPGNKHATQATLEQYWLTPIDQIDQALAANKVLVIPLYNDSESNGSKVNYQVGGFGAFVLTGINMQGNDKYLDTVFVRWPVNGEWVQATCGTDTGTYSVKLIP